MDESKQVKQERQAYKATVQDVGKEPNNLEASVGSSSDSSSGSSSEGSQDDADNNIYNNIVLRIKNWKAAA